MIEARSSKAMVTSPHRLASEAGLAVLRDGGNAIEAGVAMGSVLAVTYPHFCGLGGDAVWMVADTTGRQSSFLGIGHAGEFSKTGRAIPTRGSGSTLTTAAAVDCWGHALDYSARHWGSSHSLARLLDPAIGHAENGFPISRSQQFWHQFRWAETAHWPGFSAVFGEANRSPAAGDTFAQPQLAQSLKSIARDGTRSFYEGELAERIATGLAQAGSPLTRADLARTRTREQQPISLQYRDTTLLAPPPPTQGMSTLAIMGILERVGLGDVAEGSADFYHLCVEAVKQAFVDREHIADPDFVALDVASFLNATQLSRKAEAINRQAAMAWPYRYRTGDTVFFAATDSHGRSASVLQSIYFDWGSGVIAGNTGILWQNRGAAFSAQPGSSNAIEPDKRPFYTLNPGIALKDGKPHLLYGTQGADGQPQTLSVLLARILHYGIGPADALSRPRFLLGRTFSDSTENLKLERAAGPEVFATLATRGHALAEIPAHSPLAGQAGLIRIEADGTITGAHDPRGDGCALGLT